MNLNDLSKIELIDLILHYDNYVIEYPEDHDGEGYPVCLQEFYHNDYPLIKEEKENE